MGESNTARIFAALQCAPSCAAELAPALGLSTNAVATALKAMRDRGVIERRDHKSRAPGHRGALWGLASDATPIARTPTFWDGEGVIERMTAMWSAGRSYREIANALGHGVSRNAVCGKIMRMGLTRHGAYMRSKRVAPKRQGDDTRRGNLRKPTLTPKPLPTTLADVLSPNARPWHERESRQCAWPVSGDGADTVSCANETEPGKTYCGAHLSLYSTPAKTNMLRMARRYA